MIQGRRWRPPVSRALKPLAQAGAAEGKRATLARRPLPFPSVMCQTQGVFLLGHQTVPDVVVVVPLFCPL
ncbi:hypothetical protein ACLBOM_37635 [Escherichia coli]